MIFDYIKRQATLTPALALVAAQPVFGETADPDNISEILPPIVVSATRSEQRSTETAATISVISRQDIRESGARSVAEILQARGGVQVTDLFGDGSVSSVDMRGFGAAAAQNVLILVNGRRLNNSSDIGSPDLNTINLDDVERIEIVQGSSGVLYGNQAVGGMINIITRSPGNRLLNVRAGAGSYNAFQLDARASEQLENGINYQLSALAKRSDNYRDHNDSDTRNINARLGYRFTRGELFVAGQNVYENLQTPGALTDEEVDEDRQQVSPAFSNDYQKTRTTTWTAGGDYQFSEHWNASIDYGHRASRRDFLTSFRAFPGTPSTLDRDVVNLNPKLSGTLPTALGPVAVTTGLDYEFTNYKLSSSFGQTIQDQFITAVYAQGVTEFSQEFSATFGMRRAWVDNSVSFFAGEKDYGDAVTVGSLGLVYKPDNDWRLFTRIDQNYRFATADESTNTVTLNPADLDTQTGISYELGTEISKPAYRARLMLYQLDIHDEISFDSSTYYNINLDRTRRRGLVAEASYNLLSLWQIGGNYTYTDGRITDGAFDGNRIPLVSRHMGSLWIDGWLTRDLGVKLEAAYTGDRVPGGDFSNDFSKLDAYTVVNLTVRYEAERLIASARINNLLNEIYNETGAVGFDAAFVPVAGYFPAPERNIWLTVEYNFLP